MTEGKDPNCPKCGGNRWKTIQKGRKFQCRLCWWMTGEEKRVVKVSAPVTSETKDPVVEKKKKGWLKKCWGFLSK